MRDHRLSLYNIFPRYYPNISSWQKELEHIKSMGFTAIYINPIFYPGNSGSLYAPKDYFTIDPVFVDPENSSPPLEQLCQFIEYVHKQDMKFIFDLVINHSAIDHPMTKQRPEWYLKDKDNHIIHPGIWRHGEWIAWPDLAQFDHLHSVDRDQLWSYFANIIQCYIELGVDGFCANSAYQIPEILWKYLIKTAKTLKSDIFFIGENFGSRIEDSEMLIRAGFDYLFNSAHWWNEKDLWFIEQYNRLAPSPSITFPESHLTERLMAKVQNVTQARRNLVFHGLLSSSWMIITGTEFGWQNQPDVISTKSWDQENTTLDFTSLIKQINAIRATYMVLNKEGHLSIHKHYNDMVITIKKTWEDATQHILLILNLSDQKYVLDAEISQYTELISSDDTEHRSPQELLPYECRVLYG